MNIFKKIFSFLIVLSFVAISIMVSIPNTSANEIEEDYPIVYQQSDSRWGYHVNGNGTIGSSACGLLSVVNSVNFLNGNFIDPVEIADYAYSIKAYNIPEGGGTWRYLFYKNMGYLEEKYGFHVTNPSVESGVSDEKLKSWLENGNAAVGYVKGHFISLDGYDRKTNSFLVYDSAASVSKRHDYNRGTWLTEAELSGDVEYMIVKWYCLLKSTIERDTKLDGFENCSNGKAYATYTLDSNNLVNIPVSGYAVDSREVVSYYYVMDYSDQKVAITPCEREEAPNTSLTYDPKRLGFSGVINTQGLSLGSHYVNLCAETKNGGVCTIAEIEIRVQDSTAIDEVNRTYTVDLSSCYGQKDVLTSWTTAGINDYVFAANYGSSLFLGNLNLANFKSATIYYSVSSSFNPNASSNTSIMGLKATAFTYGYYGIDTNLVGALSYGTMENGTSSGFFEVKELKLNLENVSYNGPVYASAYHQNSEMYAIRKIVFNYNDDYEINHQNDKGYIYLKNATIDSSKVNTIKLYIENPFDEVIQIVNNFNTVIDEIKVSKSKNFYLMTLPQGLKTDLYLKTNLTLEITYLYYEDLIITNDKDVHLALDITADGSIMYSEEAHLTYENIDEPNCLEAGYKKIYCLTCGTIISDEVLSPLGHDLSDLLYNDEEHYQFCARCETYLNYAKHSYTQAYNQTSHYDICECGYQTNIEKHTFNENFECSCGFKCTHENQKTVLGISATCQRTGLTNGVICRSCGYVIEAQKTIEKVDHEYVDGVCKWCGAIEEEIPDDVEPLEPAKEGCASGMVVLTSLLTASLYLFFKKH